MKRFFIAAIAALLLVCPSRAEINFDVYINFTLMDPELVKAGVYPTTITLGETTTNPVIYSSIKITNLGEGGFTKAMLLDQISFSLTRTDLPTLGPVSFGGGVYHTAGPGEPTPSPQFLAYDQAGNIINLEGRALNDQNIGGVHTVIVNNFKFDPKLNTAGDQVQFSVTGSGHDFGGGPSTSDSSFASASVVPEPSSAVLAVLSGVGLLSLRRRKNS